MNSESRTVAELWDLVRDYIPSGRRAEIAISFLQVFEEAGYDRQSLRDLVDEDSYLSSAYTALFSEDDEVEAEELDEIFGDDV